MRHDHQVCLQRNRSATAAQRNRVGPAVGANDQHRQVDAGKTRRIEAEGCARRARSDSGARAQLNGHRRVSGNDLNARTASRGHKRAQIDRASPERDGLRDPHRACIDGITCAIKQGAVELNQSGDVECHGLGLNRALYNQSLCFDPQTRLPKIDLGLPVDGFKRHDVANYNQLAKTCIPRYPLDAAQHLSRTQLQHIASGGELQRLHPHHERVIRQTFGCAVLQLDGANGGGLRTARVEDVTVSATRCGKRERGLNEPLDSELIVHGPKSGLRQIEAAQPQVTTADVDNFQRAAVVAGGAGK